MPEERRRDEAHDETSIAHPGAESVFLWTKDKKGVDRRAVPAPLTASCSDAARARALACTSAPFAAASWETSSKYGSWT